MKSISYYHQINMKLTIAYQKKKFIWNLLFWVSIIYFPSLPKTFQFNKNEGQTTLLDLEILNTKVVDQNYTFQCRIREFKVKEPPSRMNNVKVVGPDDIPIEVWKCLGGEGISWELAHKVV